VRPVNARRPPVLAIQYELEHDHGFVVLLADSYEDELRLRSWLRRSTVFAALPALIEQLLDDLDQRDEAAA
jgi:hypothetical protein